MASPPRGNRTIGPSAARGMVMQLFPQRAPSNDSPASFALRFQTVKARIHKEIVEKLDLSKLNRWNEDRLRREVRALADQFVQGSPDLLSKVDREHLIDELMNEIFGFGPLEALMKDPAISDILVNGPHEVYIERNGRLERTDIIFADNTHLLQIIQRIASLIGRRTHDMSPLMPARLPDGPRRNAIARPSGL